MEAIRYRSTRASIDRLPPVGAERAIAEGMPPDGGLYVPDAFPPMPGAVFDPAPISYQRLAREILAPFFPGWGRALETILEKAYRAPNFDTPEIAPLVRMDGFGAAEGGRAERGKISGSAGPGGRFYLLELFHGRTCAFKDMALSALGGLLRESLDRMGRRDPVLVLTATSGDTGSAALEGLSSTEGVDVAVIYPAEGTSRIQRLQMVAKEGNRVFVAGLRGNFDEAQSRVKSIFGRSSRGEGPLSGNALSSANSINIGRLLPQIVYYAKAWRDLRREGALGPGGIMHVAVPTGNFGDILAAYYAKKMGLPIGFLICASNGNNVLADFFGTGTYDRRRELLKTESPSMDILVSSNLERLLFGACGENPERTASLMRDLAEKGHFAVNPEERAKLGDFLAGWCGDGATITMIRRAWLSCGILVDPHTSTALDVAARLGDRIGPSCPIVVAATASPYKFPRAVLGALEPEGAAAGGRLAGEDDLELVGRLERLTGTEAPVPIRSLRGKKILHPRVLSGEDLEPALAEFVSMRKEAEK